MTKYPERGFMITFCLTIYKLAEILEFFGIRIIL